MEPPVVAVDSSHRHNINVKVDSIVSSMLATGGKERQRQQHMVALELHKYATNTSSIFTVIVTLYIQVSHFS